MTLAAVAALLVTQALGLPVPLWSVLTALIVMQLSVGRSLRTSVDYLLGTIGGTIYGGVLALLIPHGREGALLAVLVLAVAPLAVLAAFKRNLNAVPVASIIIVLMPAISHASPLDQAVYRVVEVALGVVVGLLVSFLVLPAGAHQQARQEAARVLDLLARSLVSLLGGPAGRQDRPALVRLYDATGQALAQLETSAAEGESERRARLSSDPDTSPLRRTLQRLRHDIIMIGRSVEVAMTADLQARLGPPLAAFAAAAAEHLTAEGAALVARRLPPDGIALDRALSVCLAEIAAIRGEGLLRGLPDAGVHRVFALEFGLEQLRRDLADLAGVIASHAATPGVAPQELPQ
ncbi:MAG: FUSC family protein [Reyranella sp.]|nr:FUSC family protein [Reyranella sp.]